VEEESAVLVIRVWREGDELRARLTEQTEHTEQRWEQRAAAGEDAILAAVRDWLHALTRQ
jgi:hypothetical protein